MAHRILTTCALLSGLLLTAGLLVPRDAAAGSRICDRVAHKKADPGRFVSSLRPGQTGCLRGRTYDASSRGITFRRPNVTLRSRPGKRAKLVGRLWIARGANRVVVRNLKLDGRNPKDQASPTVNANKARFIKNNVTNHHTAICFLLGSKSYGRAGRTLIRDNRIHDCGRLPATNHDHGIYVAHAAGTRILGNWIHGNADRGIQLYPNADRTLVRGNVISRNGQGIIFSGDDDDVSQHNVVEGNTIRNSIVRWNVDWHWQGNRVGNGNILRRNCVFGGVRDSGNGGIRSPFVGFVAYKNTTSKRRCR